MPQVTMRLDDALMKAVDGMCEARGVTRSALMRIALLDYLGGRSEAEAIGLTLTRIIDAFEGLQSSLGQIRTDMRRTQENARISGEVQEAILKVLLYRTVPPHEEDLGAKARALADYAEIAKRIARKVRAEPS